MLRKRNPYVPSSSEACLSLAQCTLLAFRIGPSSLGLDKCGIVEGVVKLVTVGPVAIGETIDHLLDDGVVKLPAFQCQPPEVLAEQAIRTEPSARTLKLVKIWQITVLGGRLGVLLFVCLIELRVTQALQWEDQSVEMGTFIRQDPQCAFGIGTNSDIRVLE